MLSGLALAGVAVSLLLQWRQTRLQTILALRQRHFDLVKLGIDDPRLLGRTMGQVDDAEKTLLDAHANLWVGHWAMLWDLNQCDEAQLRGLAAGLFRGETARDWWLRNSPQWSAKFNRRRRLFHEVLSEECARARLVATTDAARLKASQEPQTAVSKREPWQTTQAGATLGLVVVGAVAAVILVSRRQRVKGIINGRAGGDVPPARRRASVPIEYAHLHVCHEGRPHRRVEQ